MLIFVPTSAAELAAWARGGVRSGVDAVAATPAFLAAFGLAAADPADREEAAPTRSSFKLPKLSGKFPATNSVKKVVDFIKSFLP